MSSNLCRNTWLVIPEDSSEHRRELQIQQTIRILRLLCVFEWGARAVKRCTKEEHQSAYHALPQMCPAPASTASARFLFGMLMKLQRHGDMLSFAIEADEYWTVVYRQTSILLFVQYSVRFSARTLAVLTKVFRSGVCHDITSISTEPLPSKLFRIHRQHTARHCVTIVQMLKTSLNKKKRLSDDDPAFTATDISLSTDGPYGTKFTVLISISRHVSLTEELL